MNYKGMNDTKQTGSGKSAIGEEKAKVTKGNSQVRKPHKNYFLVPDNRFICWESIPSN